MATRTINTPDDVEAAVAYLARSRSQSNDDYLMAELGKVFDDLMKEANDKRFEEVANVMKGSNKADVIKKLREMLC